MTEQSDLLAAIDILAPDAPVPDGACPFCRKAIETIEKFVYVAHAGQSLIPAHAACAHERREGKVSAMATYETVKDLPACSMCGREYEDHDRPVTTIWAAMCCTPDGRAIARLENGRTQYYRPAAPFPAQDWPHDMITDSPVYAMTDEQFAAFEAPPTGQMSRAEIDAFEREYASFARASFHDVKGNAA